MTSIKDAIEESWHDEHAFFKILFISILLYLNLYLFSNYHNNWTIALAVVTILLVFGFMLKCTYNVRTGENRVLPSFNVFKWLFAGIKGLIAIAPLLILSNVLGAFICGWISTLPIESKFISFFTYAIFAIFNSFVFTGYLLYSNDFKILDAYNVKLIFKYCIDVLIALFFVIIQLLIANAIILSAFIYLLWLFLGLTHPISIFFWCFAFSFNVAVIGHCLAQINFEIIDIKENNKDEDIIEEPSSYW